MTPLADRERAGIEEKGIFTTWPRLLEMIKVLSSE